MINVKTEIISHIQSQFCVKTEMCEKVIIHEDSIVSYSFTDKC